ncbi:hypothetical protein HOLleu_34905 [Holothuria leucospilota]|uniref:Integrase core domain-containing protein n=1 Tax=Holothuria leucospilota TaxID=206669 RepID=A0A9Q0YSM7_HOLLE|nr:hypothetical protein HOLleu_34905 [Holothuria leucospilota]
MTRDRLFRSYFHLGLSYPEIVANSAQLHSIVLSERHLKRILRQLGLFRRNRFVNIEEILLFIHNELQGSAQLHGYRWMHLRCIQNGYSVSREMVREIIRVLDPEGVELRRRRRLVRRRYYSKGPNYICHMESYDKLKPYGIAINGCIDGFSRKLLWPQANYTSTNPRNIPDYFMTPLESIGGCPLVVRADRGTENSVVAILQRYLRREGNDNSGGERSFLYGCSNNNWRIEC